jgi:hypothetical protein
MGASADDLTLVPCQSSRHADSDRIVNGQTLTDRITEVAKKNRKNNSPFNISGSVDKFTSQGREEKEKKIGSLRLVLLPECYVT